MYLSGIGSTTIARRLGIRSKGNVLVWIARYRKYGVQGLEIRSPKYDPDKKRKNYTKTAAGMRTIDIPTDLVDLLKKVTV